MIRIDEIYQNTFRPWLAKNRPGIRSLLCHPFGHSDPESIIAYSRDDHREHNYIFFFDQEPIHLNTHVPTFDRVMSECADINSDFYVDRYAYNHLGQRRGFEPIPRPPGFVAPGYLVTSERDSENVDYICAKYRWKPLYYFFHGWAALDWYRGYDRTFLIEPWAQRQPTRTFIAPNRIIAGERQHRLEVLYHIFKRGMTDNHISCPETCPAENISIYDAVKALPYDDAESVFRSVDLPICFEGETGHPMHSCWLSLFDQAADSLLYLVTETVATGQRHHLTEKTFKPIALGMPFVIVGTRGSLKYLRSYGFRTFEGIWDESYDDAEDAVRIQRIASLLQSLNELTPEGRQDLFYAAQQVIEHNWNHFYGGGFESILWQELQSMLHSIDSCEFYFAPKTNATTYPVRTFI